MRFTCVVIWIAVSIGCSDDGVTESPPNPAKSKSIVKGFYDLDAARVAGDGTGAAFAARFLALDMASVVPAPETDFPIERRIIEPSDRTPGAITGCTCTASGCNFASCGDDDPTLAWKLDGSIAIADTGYAFDLSYSDKIFTWTLVGDITLAPTRVTGSISTDQECCSGPMTTRTVIELADVVVDAMHCPIGGTFHGDVAVAVPDDKTQTYHVAGELQFGPTCFQPQD